MIVGLFLKIIFASAIWWWVFPSFIRRKSVMLLIMKILFMIITCMTCEIFTSWQFKVFSVGHMMHYTSSVVWLNLIIYLGITIILVIIFFTRQWIENERKQRELNEMRLATELAYLRSQVHPHFLFNTLNNIFSIAQRDHNHELALSISRLSGLLRYLLHDGGQGLVLLKKEVDHLRDFIGLAVMRYSPDEVTVEFSVTGETDPVLIAPMILMPFVENAFKHGINIEEKSTIKISIRVEQNKILFECSNQKGSLKLSSEESSGIGLNNVKRRIALLYPDKHALEITDTETSYIVTLMLQA